MPAPKSLKEKFASKADTSSGGACSFQVGDVVKAADRGNVGRIESVDRDRITVTFVNAKTGKSRTKTFSADELSPVKRKKSSKQASDNSAPEAQSVGSDRPTIRLMGGALPAEIDQAEAALLEGVPTIFQRAGRLIRIAEPSRSIPGIERPKGLVSIVQVDAAHIREEFTRRADWLKHSGRDDEWHPVNAPHEHAACFVSRGTWNVPYLVGVSFGPTMRADGSILVKPGYDPLSGIFVADQLDIPTIPECPSWDDALQALTMLREPLEEFPFAAESDRAAAVAANLGAVIRKALPTAPLVGFSSHTAGSGKGKLAKYVSIPVTGKSPVIIHQGHDDTETEKRLSSALMAGVPVASIDNIEYPLGGEMLCSSLTEVEISPRILGKSENVTTPTNITLLATGNNLRPKGDMVRRMLVCEIDPGIERPEERTFRRNLDVWLPQNRARLVYAALVVVRAYLAHGCPDVGLTPVGSFEKWSQWVRNPLVWLGMADPWETNARIRQSDPISQSLASLLTLWERVIGNGAWTLSEVVAACEQTEEYDPIAADRAEFRQILLGISDGGKGGKLGINTRRLGHYLAKYAGRIIEGRKVVIRSDAHQKINRYQVVQCSAKQPLELKHETPQTKCLESKNKTESAGICGVCSDPSRGTMAGRNNSLLPGNRKDETPRNPAVTHSNKNISNLTCGVSESQKRPLGITCAKCAHCRPDDRFPLQVCDCAIGVRLNGEGQRNRPRQGEECSRFEKRIAETTRSESAARR